MTLTQNVLYISYSLDKYGDLSKYQRRNVNVFVDNSIDSRYYSSAGGIVVTTTVYLSFVDAKALQCKVGDRMELKNLSDEVITYQVQKITQHKEYIGLVI